MKFGMFDVVVADWSRYEPDIAAVTDLQPATSYDAHDDLLPADDATSVCLDDDYYDDDDDDELPELVDVGHRDTEYECFDTLSLRSPLSVVSADDSVIDCVSPGNGFHDVACDVTAALDDVFIDWSDVISDGRWYLVYSRSAVQVCRIIPAQYR